MKQEPHTQHETDWPEDMIFKLLDAIYGRLIKKEVMVNQERNIEYFDLEGRLVLLYTPEDKALYFDGREYEFFMAYLSSDHKTFKYFLSKWFSDRYGYEINYVT